jgi:UDP-hydrolysing UDP-N-acetyl-D-glucosamine 2-epimerase
MKVAVVTGSRADYGLLRPILDALRGDPGFDPCLLATAMHLDPTYGDMLAEITADGNTIAAHVRAGAPVLDAGDFARNIGWATVSFTDTLALCKPDLLLVLGDRFEILAAALAATSLRIPIAHIHGGELSEGSLDDALRHCITKLSHLHFVATRLYAERVCQLGEAPSSVHVVGAAGPGALRNFALLDRTELAAALSIHDLPSPLVALTLHPASLKPAEAATEVEAVTHAVDEVLGGRGCVVATMPNDDPGSTVIRERLSSWAHQRADRHLFAALGHRLYLSLLRCADVVVGNSSSAIIEAPSFRVPVVNIGDRQRGRMMTANIVSCGPQRTEVAAALRRALDPTFRSSLGDLENPYDRGDIAARILTTLRSTTPGALGDKRFFDIPGSAWRAALQFADDASINPKLEHVDV